ASLVGEQSRIVNRMKATLIRLGIRGFNPKLKKAAERLDGLRTPEGEPIPPNTLAELRRDMARRRLVRDQIRQIEDARLERLKQAPSDGPHAMVRLLARVIGVGVETADMLVQEILSRSMRDRRAIARYTGLTGSPDESGRKRREKGLTRSGNARVRRGMIQLAWRFLFDHAPPQWAHGLVGHGDAPVLREVVETPQSQDRTPRCAIPLAMPPAAVSYRASGLVLCAIVD
ncbi:MULTISPECIES: transposase, partial [unclassified Bradyrhizobium]|uniref:transposase n=1 Tax=unclassified Bradyrhizobium TaxID=2631580 RepID=UPI001FF71934